MRFCLLLILASLLLVNRAHSQTLTEKLIAEKPAKLAELARKNGDIVRGTILFHQGNINCSNCHRPKSEKDRKGPDLSRLGQDATDEQLIESILEPSKAIRKGFETISLVTLDGEVIDGIVVKESGNEIVIRRSSNVEQLVTIKTSDVDEIQPNAKSLMPDGLVDQLKNRQQFLDLVLYVIDIKERGPVVAIADSIEPGTRQLTPELEGAALINKLNCVGCHPSSDKGQMTISSKSAPDLRWSGQWLNPNYISEFVADPHATKPGTSMPNILGNLEPDEQEKSADALMHYLIVQSGNQYKPETVADLESVRRGFDTFHAIGCVACHSPRDDRAAEIPYTDKTLGDTIPLGDLSNKYGRTGLVAFLENPHLIRSSGRMPRMQLTHSEAEDVASYFLQNTNKNWMPTKADPKLAEKGKQLFVELNCASCHGNIVDNEAVTASRVSMQKLSPGLGCLSGGRGDWPEFKLNRRETSAINAALKNTSAQLTNEQKIDVSLRVFNCTACHERNNLGGVDAVRNPHFQTTNLNLGDQGRIPPTLTGVGAKLKSNWMRDVLVNGRTVRPYMKTRMPQYGEENVGHLVQLFQQTDKLPKTEFATFKDQKEMREMGLHLAGNKGLNCVACHTYKFKLSDTMPAVDVTEMTDRLKKDWFYQYMLAPQKFSPNTVMPSFWPGGVAIRKDLEGSPELQVEALWQYLVDGRQARMPSGVVREPLEIIVTSEAQMLRRSYPGIGKRGIGVGYPGEVNIAFDAEQMRLAMIWKGKFVDPGGVWNGQGSGNVRPKGKVINFLKGPDLDDSTKPWAVDDGRPPNHQFRGYELDKNRRPTFRYSFDNVEVNDFCSQANDSKAKKTYLRRTVSMESTNGRDNLTFRVAEGEKIEDKGNQVFLVNGMLQIRIVCEDSAEIVNSVEGKRLIIPLKLPAGKKQELVVEYDWE